MILVEAFHRAEYSILQLYDSAFIVCFVRQHCWKSMKLRILIQKMKKVERFFASYFKISEIITLNYKHLKVHNFCPRKLKYVRLFSAVVLIHLHEIMTHMMVSVRSH